MGGPPLLSIWSHSTTQRGPEHGKWGVGGGLLTRTIEKDPFMVGKGKGKNGTHKGKDPFSSLCLNTHTHTDSYIVYSPTLTEAWRNTIEGSGTGREEAVSSSSPSFFFTRSPLRPHLPSCCLHQSCDPQTAHPTHCLRSGRGSRRRWRGRSRSCLGTWVRSTGPRLIVARWWGTSD